MRTDQATKGSMVSLMLYDAGYITIQKRFDGETAKGYLLSALPKLRSAGTIEIRGLSSFRESVMYVDCMEPIRSKLFKLLVKSHKNKDPNQALPSLEIEGETKVKSEFLKPPVPFNPYGPKRKRCLAHVRPAYFAPVRRPKW